MNENLYEIFAEREKLQLSQCFSFLGTEIAKVLKRDHSASTILIGD